MMKWTSRVLIGLTVVGAIFFAVSVARLRTLKKVCTTPNSYALKRLVLEGQGRRAVLTDRACLAYFSSTTKYRRLPDRGRLADGFSFEAKFYDSWGAIGSVDLFISADQQTISIIGVERPLGLEYYSYLLIESNAPPELRMLIQFLLKEENRGKNWQH